MESFRLNDPVLVETSANDDQASTTSSYSIQSSSHLEGVVAHVGPVQFAPGNDWIGVRLTGPSVGLGRNDGTVKGVRYFDAGSAATKKNGVFVKKSHVKKRHLTRLEELRLRRELGDTNSQTSRRGAAATAAASTKPSPKTGGRPASSRLKSSAPPPSTSAPRSRLEEIRARREALAREREQTPSSAKTARRPRTSLGKPSQKAPSRPLSNAPNKLQEANEPNEEPDESTADESKADENTTEDSKAQEEPQVNLQTATAGYRAELQRLQDQVASLKASLKDKEAECSSLQASLDFMSQGAEQTTHDAVRMYALGALALTEAKTPGKTPSKPAKTPSKDTKTPVQPLDDDEEIAQHSSDDSSDDSSHEEDEKPRSLGQEMDDEADANDQVVSQAAAAVSQALVERNDALTSQLSTLTSQNTHLQHQIEESQEKISHLTSRLERITQQYQEEKQGRMDDRLDFNTEKSVLSSQLSSLEREVQIAQDRMKDKLDTKEQSYVAVAKLRAEISSLQRKNEGLLNDKMELETTCEELVLDKEQLKEEKELLEDQLEECKIDLESTQLELEDVKSQLSRQGDITKDVIAETKPTTASPSSSSSTADSHDVTRSLTIQNTRLRTALLRLREQSELERADLMRQVKLLKTESESSSQGLAELEELKQVHATSLEEMQELKDIIDQHQSLEETIENLSDKVWTLEERNADLERTVRELEESAEIAAEMEEVQNEERVMLLRDLEGRDALVRNLEEAIRMQRRREEDFQRYVSEFRTSISTLQQEKAALLALTEGDQGEKTHLLATSQKALAQAAQLAADAAQARKRDAEAAFDRIASRSASYLSQRLEMLLPPGVVSAELAAVKGELLLAKVADKAAVSLYSVEEVFQKAIQKGLAGLSEFNVLEGGESAALTDVSSHQIEAMLHQTEFASMTVEAASDALRLMAAGQWPDLLSLDLSTDLGSAVVHSIAHLDLALSEQLKLLKQEGVLSPLRSSLTELDQSVRSTRLALFSTTDEMGKAVVPTEWKPPGWEALKILSLGRFTCLGATAVISSAVSPMSDEPPAPTLPNLAGLLERANQNCTSMLEVCKKLSGLRLNDAETLESLNELAAQYQTKSSALFECIKTTFKQQSVSEEDVGKCSALLEEVLLVTRKLAALLRKANLGEHDTTDFHSLSPEFGDAWGGVSRVVTQVRSWDGDADDVNYLMRARAIERQLAEAVQNEPKLVIANAKIASLEKSLSSRSKEISMQNTRINELEILISKTSVPSMTPIKGPKPSATAETNKLKEEVRVLQEALDVTQKQVEEYEKEIKSAKDKSRPSRVRQAGTGRVTPRKNAIDIESTLSQFSQASASKSSGNSSRDAQLESISLETALFRPALSRAMNSANYWKAQAMGSALSQLPPLNVPINAHSMPSSAGEDACKVLDDLFLKTAEDEEKPRRSEEIFLAKNNVRSAKASFTVVDLTKGSSRLQFQRELQKEKIAELRLQEAASSWLNESSGVRVHSSEETKDQGELWGRVTVPCQADTGYVVPLTVNRDELRNFHSYLLQ